MTDTEDKHYIKLYKQIAKVKREKKCYEGYWLLGDQLGEGDGLPVEIVCQRLKRLSLPSLPSLQLAFPLHFSMFPDVLLCFHMFSRSWNISSFLLLLLLRGVSRLPWQIASVMWWKEHRRPNVRLSGGPTLSRFSSSSSIYLHLPTNPSIYAISWWKDSSFPLDQNRFSKPPFSSSRSMFVFDAKRHDPGSLQTLCQTFRPFDCSGRL